MKNIKAIEQFQICQSNQTHSNPIFLLKIRSVGHPLKAKSYLRHLILYDTESEIMKLAYSENYLIDEFCEEIAY